MNVCRPCVIFVLRGTLVVVILFAEEYNMIHSIHTTFQQFHKCIPLAVAREAQLLIELTTLPQTNPNICDLAIVLPVRWETSMSSEESGGRIFIRLLQRSKEFIVGRAWCVLRGAKPPNSCTPTVLCSRSSAWRSRTVCYRAPVTSSSLLFMVGCKINRKRSATRSSSKATNSDRVKLSPIFSVCSIHLSRSLVRITIRVFMVAPNSPVHFTDNKSRSSENYIIL